MDSRNHDRRAVVLTRIRYCFMGLLLAGALALLPFRTVKVDGQSMEPTLRSGETYLLDTYYWRSGGLRRGDIVVVRRGEEKWVKRLFGIPGDRLLIASRRSGWIVSIQNLSVEAAPREGPPGAFAAVRQVEPGEIFVVGDNLNRSEDSTTQEVGAFKLQDVLGIVRTFALRRQFPMQKHL